MGHLLYLDGTSLTQEDLLKVARDRSSTWEVKVHPSVIDKIKHSYEWVQRCLDDHRPFYGINTGFGNFSKVRIEKKRVEEIQYNILRSHAVGQGEAFSTTEVRAMMLLRANTLVSGYSGVSINLIDKLLELLNKQIHPRIPQKGSVGASGDLAPLAHMALALIGEGEACIGEGPSFEPTSHVLKKKGVGIYSLQAKEGLSLINGTQVMTAVASINVDTAESHLKHSFIAAALSIEALQGSRSPFDPRIGLVRPHPGQMKVSSIMRDLLGESEISLLHKDCDRVQDAYSLRCIPQVYGVAFDALNDIKKTVLIEMNSVTDNPLVFPDSGDIVSGGNFHGEYIASAMDRLAMVSHEVANMTEQRIQKLMNPAFSSLPSFLTQEGGYNSGFMLVQVLAASLVSENKILCHPASIDSIPTSADKEDHVSMGTIAARKCREVLKNCMYILSSELLCGVQGLSFLQPAKVSSRLQPALDLLRSKIPPITVDRAFYKDLDLLNEIVSQKVLLTLLQMPQEGL